MARNTVSSFSHSSEVPANPAVFGDSSSKPLLSRSLRKPLIPVIADIKFRSELNKPSYDAASRLYSADHIAKLKANDPVFAKRHKQVQSAKQCNKAPEFDVNDYNIAHARVQDDVEAAPQRNHLQHARLRVRQDKTVPERDANGRLEGEGLHQESEHFLMTALALEHFLADFWEKLYL